MTRAQARTIGLRLAQAPLVILAVYVVTFLLAWALPGSAALDADGRQPPPQVVEALEQRYHLDNPWRFGAEYLAGATGLRWAAAKIAGDEWPRGRPVFDLGPSMRYADWTVNEILAGSLPVSATLGLLAIAIALVIGLTAGVVGGVRPGSVGDGAALVVALVGVSLPSFVVGTLLLIVFPVWLGWGRVAAWGSPADAILPALTLSLPFAAYIARLTRMGMIEAMASDYVRTARAKGVPERDIVLKHALRNAFLPVLSYLGPATAFAMTGSFVVERVFNVPGVGQHFVAAVLNRDLFLLMGVVLVYATMLVVFNLVVDLLASVVDPRIRSAG